MRSLIPIFVLICYSNARPTQLLRLRGGEGAGGYIIGGKDAVPGAWPWQLSLQAYSGSWSHTCGATLLSSQYALCVAHCVDGVAASNRRVIAGLHDRRDTTATQTSTLASYTKHPQYNPTSIVNDISILKMLNLIMPDNFKIVFATLPPNNNNDFNGATCVLTGWGKTSSTTSNLLPNILQQVNMGIISSQSCSQRMAVIAGSVVNDNHICAYDTAQQRGSCQGDSGGPMNCPDSTLGYVVAGVTSWGASTQAGECLTSYPSVYTRTSTYLSWIASNTPVETH